MGPAHGLSDWLIVCGGIIMDTQFVHVLMNSREVGCASANTVHDDRNLHLSPTTLPFPPLEEVPAPTTVPSKYSDVRNTVRSAYIWFTLKALREGTRRHFPHVHTLAS